MSELRAPPYGEREIAWWDSAAVVLFGTLWFFVAFVASAVVVAAWLKLVIWLLSLL